MYKMRSIGTSSNLSTIYTLGIGEFKAIEVEGLFPTAFLK
jgi:hypothetical protein